MVYNSGEALSLISSSDNTVVRMRSSKNLFGERMENRSSTFLTNLGCETLHVRMERHCENALALAKFLQKHPAVSWVNYPGLPESSQKERVAKYLPRGTSGVLCFGVKGGKAAGEIVMNSLKLAAIVVHVADVRTGVLHPASMTHRQLTEEEQIAAGVSPDLIRVSVGIEHIDDLTADFDQALRKTM